MGDATAVPKTPRDSYGANPPGCRLGALAAIRDHTGRLLLVKKTYLDTPKPWGLVGGNVEEHETLRAAWQREVEEETGLTLRPGRLLCLDEVPAREGKKKGLNIILDGGRIHADTTIVLPPEELSAYAFVARDDLADHLTDHQQRRAHAVLDTLEETANPAYLIRGRHHTRGAAS